MRFCSILDDIRNKKKEKEKEKQNRKERIEELGKQLSVALSEFMTTKCKCKPHYISPRFVIDKTWIAYCKEVNIYDNYIEYINYFNFYAPKPMLSVIKHNYKDIYAYPFYEEINSLTGESKSHIIPQFYIGIRLISYPNEQAEINIQLTE